MSESRTASTKLLRRGGEQCRRKSPRAMLWVILGLCWAALVVGPARAQESTARFEFEAELQTAAAFAQGRYGASVAVSDPLAAVGDPQVDGQRGAVQLFRITATSQGRVGRLTALDAEPGDGFGTAVALAGDYLVVGAPGDDDAGEDAGAIYVYQRNPPLPGGVEAADRVISLPWVADSHASTYTFWPIAKLTANDALAGDRFGSAVAAVDGNATLLSIIVGSPGRTVAPARAYLLRLASLTETWSTTRMNGDVDSEFGAAVAISFSSLYTVAVVGAPGADDDTGRAWRFFLNGDELVDTSSIQLGGPGQRFGAAVAVSDRFQAYNSRIVVGAPTLATGGGSVWVLQRDDCTDSSGCQVPGPELEDWDQWQVGSGHHRFGAALALDGPGDTQPELLIVGAPDLPSRAGTVAIYQFGDSGPPTLDSEHQATTPAAADGYGGAVAFDWTRSIGEATAADPIVVGFPDGGAGSELLSFVSDSDIWTPAALPSRQDRHSAVALAGERAAVGASGRVFLYRRDAEGWGPWLDSAGQPMVLGDDLEGGRYGFAVAMDAAARVLVVGSPDRGRAYRYHRVAGEWQLVQVLEPPVPDAGGLFGYAVAVSEDGQRVAVGDPFFYEPQSDRRRANVLIFDGGDPGQRLLSAAASPAFGGHFGATIALSGDTLAVGEIGATVPCGAADCRGALRLFEHQGSWSEVAGSPWTAGTGSSFFAWSLALREIPGRGGLLAVGSPRAPSSLPGVTFAGQVYALAYDPEFDGRQSWAQVLGLAQPTGETSCPIEVTCLSGELDFGADLAFGLAEDTAVYQEDMLLVGEPRSGATGRLHVFQRDLSRHNGWLEPQVHKGGSAGHTNDELGRSLAADGDSLLAAAKTTFNSQSATDGGSAAAFGPSLAAPAVAGYARHLLYPPAEDSTDPARAAFRYKYELYGEDPNDAQLRVRKRLELLADLYADPERRRNRRAECLLRQALDLHPANADLGDLLLDLLYDRTAAELLFLHEGLAELDRIRLGLVIPDPAAGEGVIDDEIQLYEQVINGFFSALRGGAAPADLDPELRACGAAVADGPPLGLGGYFDLLLDADLTAGVFQAAAAGRGLEGAATLDSDGLAVPVIDCGVDCTPLFDGYKDLVLLFQALADFGSQAAELARLYALRAGAGDLDAAQAVIDELQTHLYLEGNLLLGLFPELRADLEQEPPPEDLRQSGIDAAVAGWRNSLSRLSTTRSFLVGQVNPLGFEDDFLMLVQKFQGQSDDIFDSYDAFRELLDPAADNPTSALRVAADRQLAARLEYDLYRGYQDQLGSQLQGLNVHYDERLFDIVGVNPGEPGYDTPEQNVGSEIWQQVQSLAVARLGIEQNRQEIDNLKAQVEIEIERRGQEAGISNAMQQVYLDYGEQQAQLTEEIAQIEAAQAFSEGATEGISSGSGLTAATAGVVNGSVQAGGELLKGSLEADKERLAAQQQADIVALEDQLLDINSQAQIKTWLLRMSTLALESEEAALLAKQEIGRLVALYDEKANLERRKAEALEELGERYFADPVHRLRTERSMLRASLAFEEAQKWLFFMGRGLEFKWNTPFAHSYLDRDFQLSSVFRARNATELEDLFLAMNDYDLQIQGSLVRDDYFDWFSVREDFLGYQRFDELGQPLLYSDVETGERIDALEAFRRHLARLQDSQGNIYLDFSTVREIPGGTFFRGPRYDSAGNLISSGLFLDKIIWLKINLPGTHSVSNTQLTGELSLGGTAYVRNFDVGQRDPDRPDRIAGEMTAYSSRYWFFHAPSDQWRFEDVLSAPVPMQLSSDPRVPPSVQEIEVFKERSVAASQWRLVLPTRDAGVTVLNLEELDDIELFFFHSAVVRP